MAKTVRIAQCVIITVPLALFGWLLWQELVPTGVFAVHAIVGRPSPFIDRLLPDGRVDPPGPDAAGEMVQVVHDDPVFFFAHPHRSFNEADVDVWFKNTDTPIVELGGLADPVSGAYDLKPLQNLLIDHSTWDRMDADGVVLLQRDKTYASIGDFLANPPPREKIATYHYTLARPFVLEGYAPSPQSRTVDVSLRGFHAFKTYIKNETLTFDIAYMDMNRDDGAEPVTVVVSRDDGTVVDEERVPDDGDIGHDAAASAVKHIHLSVPGLVEGVYKVELRAERDVFFRTLTTTQQKIVFMDNVYLGDDVGWKEAARAVHFWTEAKHLAFTTQHADGVQDVQVGTQVAHVSAPYARTPVEVSDEGVVEVVVPRADMMVDGDGHIAFSPDQYFNPDPARLNFDTDLDRLGVDYVIANYVSPRVEGDWFVASASFDTAKLAFLEGAWKFVISVPGIRETNASLSVHAIDMLWKRSPL